jgi:hypothetical protein
MSQALLTRASRPSVSRLDSEPDTRLRTEAEATLRDLAFVYHLTQRVKATIIREQPGRAAD